MNTSVENIETHPHQAFVPPNAKVLIIGTFPGKGHDVPREDDWFYSATRNQFWKIISQVYQVALPTKKAKQDLFYSHGIAIADLFLKVRRTENNNADSNLEVVEYNDGTIGKILRENDFQSILFTSAFVQKSFQRLFPDILIGKTLPSPSPRYARMTVSDKVLAYRSALPE